MYPPPHNIYGPGTRSLLPERSVLVSSAVRLLRSGINGMAWQPWDQHSVTQSLFMTAEWGRADIYETVDGVGWYAGRLYFKLESMGQQRS